MGVLDEVTAQFLDKAADVVLGPSVGYVTATSSVGGTIINRGQLGKLPDGRLVRAVAGARVATSGTPVRVRLASLSPSYPAASNFAPVAGGVVVTW